MRLTVELDKETDGRWIAEVPELPGVMVYGDTRDDAIRAVEALALHALAERLEQRAQKEMLGTVEFVAPKAA